MKLIVKLDYVVVVSWSAGKCKISKTWLRAPLRIEIEFIVILI